SSSSATLHVVLPTTLLLFNMVSHTFLFLFFLFSFYLIDLHSFPTRRSSDLCTLGTNEIYKTTLYVNSFLQFTYLFYTRVFQHNRSEEHTSELQSRFDLVCRLLLEKKKPNCEERSKR